MAFAAGRRLLAAHMNAFRQGMQSLPSNDAQAVANVFQAWGSPIDFGDPECEISVTGVGQGYGINTSDASSGALMRIEISLDGGSTWDAGPAIRQDIGSGAADQRGAVGPVHYVTGTPTGDVQVRMTHSSQHTNTSFWSGALTATMMPTGE